MHDWHTMVRARLAGAQLYPEDEAEIAEEIAQHLEAQYAELAPRLGAAAARDQLLAELAEESLDEMLIGRRKRDQVRRGVRWDSSAKVDLRYGLRSLRRAPGTAAAAVAALALGIGLTSVMFSIIYGLLIKGLPFAHPGSIAMIYRADPTGRGREDLVPLGDYLAYAARQRSFVSLGGYATTSVTLMGGDHPERVDAARVVGAALGVTGVPPVLGRSFMPSDNAAGAVPTAVLSYALWHDRFAADSSVLNREVRVDGQNHVIIGVMPAGFTFPDKQEIWLPLAVDGTLSPGKGASITLVGRLGDGIEFASANAELLGISRQLESAYADTGAVRTRALPYIRARVPGRVYSLLYSMLGAVFLVLLVACANVANLLLGRAVSRTREIGIRLALGASRLAVVRQSLVESGILTALAAVVGTMLAQVGIVAFNRAMRAIGDLPFWMDVKLHWPVLAFILCISAVASLASAVLPALHAARLDVNTILKDETHTVSSRQVGRLSRLIVVGEIALSSVMLLPAGFMTKSIVQLRTFAPRFTTEAVFTARVSPVAASPLARQQFLASLEASLTTVAGLDGVYLGNGLPGPGWRGDRISIDGSVYVRPQDRPIARWLAVTPGFFPTFDVRILRGRPILASDRESTAHVADISESFAHQYFGHVDPIGKRIRIGSDSTSDWLTIVGIMPSLYAAGPVSLDGDHFPPEVLTAFWQQHDLSSASLALRGPTTIANAATLRRAAVALDADAPVYGAATMREVIDQPMWPARVFGTLFIIFGIASLFLAAIGLYAVMAFSTSRRVREMGIRLALGATSGSVIRLICADGARHFLAGIAVGLVAGAGLVRAMRLLLFEVQPHDLTVYTLVATVLGMAAFIACLIPAVRATRTDPLIALRAE